MGVYDEKFPIINKLLAAKGYPNLDLQKVVLGNVIFEEFGSIEHLDEQKLAQAKANLTAPEWLQDRTETEAAGILEAMAAQIPSKMKRLQAGDVKTLDGYNTMVKDPRFKNLPEEDQLRALSKQEKMQVDADRGSEACAMYEKLAAETLHDEGFLKTALGEPLFLRAFVHIPEVMQETPAREIAEAKKTATEKASQEGHQPNTDAHTARVKELMPIIEGFSLEAIADNPKSFIATLRVRQHMEQHLSAPESFITHYLGNIRMITADAKHTKWEAVVSPTTNIMPAGTTRTR